jgi:hypothetical protein
MHISNAATQHYQSAWHAYLGRLKPDISPDLRWRIPMKQMVLAAVAALSLGTSVAAFAQPPAGTTPPDYGASAFTDHRNQPQVHFLGKGTVFARIFGHSKTDHAVANKTAATSASGG